MSDWIIKETAEGVTQNDLLDAIQKAYSIENHAAHGIDELSPASIGTAYADGAPNRLYVLYRHGDTFWYKTLIRAGSVEMELYERIFGRKEPFRDKRKGKR